ncbi:hypothetical protein B0O99DRAFT_733683 [Bisporella sp. PMI_857]|nr:hypothetical protein B0O99DRAFT_733683 [Bisporella sp. PMI_857]
MSRSITNIIEQPIDKKLEGGYGPFIAEAVHITENGRIDVDLDSRLSRVLSQLIPSPTFDANRPPTPPPKYERVPIRTAKLNIVIQIIGSRGDVQPFIAIGNELQKHGHRVRLATHNVFASFVREHGLEFYPVGGDPAELMAYMVKNPGLIPSMGSLKAGDIQSKRKMIVSMLEGFWKSCVEADLETHVPFTADAIIGNPPSFAPIHCAQALGCPVHIMFTMPWSCTRSFPHPLANLKSSSKDTDTNSGNSNYLSYMVVEFLTWQGLGDIINKWRKSLDLEPIPATEGPLLAETLRVPFTYCWSPALVPKPRDWPAHIDVCGFFFREAPNFDPPADLSQFLSKGPPPVYIGFGSIVIDDPDKMTAMILEAIQLTNTRAVISRGWSKLGGANQSGERVFYLEDCPHEWLFQHVAAVIHHGGAGTTACGLLNARPTVIVPFFGDQTFWGNMVAAAGAGPQPIPYKNLTSQKIAEAIRFSLTPNATIAATEVAVKMRAESGVKTAVESFHKALPQQDLQCDILQGQSATWLYKNGKHGVKLSRLAAQVLSSHLKVDLHRLQYHEPAPIVIEARRWDPLTAATSASLEMFFNFMSDTAGIVTKPLNEYKQSRPPKIYYSGSGITTPNSDANGNSQQPVETVYGHRGNVNSPRTGAQMAGVMAAASAKSLGNAIGRPYKSIFVDVPLAVTDGLYAVPKLYGGEVRERGKITDFKSGTIVAGKSFVYGIVGGLSDIAIEPYKGGKKEGALGVVKGVGKGSLGFLAKTGAAGLGLLAYTGQGVCKSIYASHHAGTRKFVIERRIEEGRYQMEHAINGHLNRHYIIRKFDQLILGGDKEWI